MVHGKIPEPAALDHDRLLHRTFRRYARHVATAEHYRVQMDQVGNVHVDRHLLSFGLPRMEFEYVFLTLHHVSSADCLQCPRTLSARPSTPSPPP